MMAKEQQEFSELERVYQKAIEKLSGQNADLTTNLNLALAQLEIAEEDEKAKKDAKK